ncbi:trehalose 6-phosphate synthase [Pancytospora epiphaga]|nr:trehalose 6-phosphate synthase [Pancytospora epiphaga]
MPMKLIVASNRLPLTVKKTDEGFDYKKSSGGLVTGIESLSKHLEFIWIGSIGGIDVSKTEQDTINKDCWEKFRCIPVFLSTSLNDRYYDGFCNAILWPSFHSFPDDVCFTFDEYDAYKEANMRFAERILEQCEEGDIVWIHDYHLMLVPGILRNRVKNLKLMFFFHTTFPDASNLSHLLYRNQILGSVCACDVVSFHLPEYALNFRDAVKDIPKNTAGDVSDSINLELQLKALPIGIDPEMFRKALKEPETQERMAELRKRFNGKRIILGVDRTDYIKGIPHKMKGFKRLLERTPGIEKDVVLLQIGIPSRLTVKEYSAYVAKISELVTQINGTVGDIVNTPIHLLFKSVCFNELVALYAISDIILITSVMDGMNLVALEYAAVQDENKGVVVLSKFAGAQATLQGSIVHNPNNTEEIAEAIEKALGLSQEERNERHEMNKRNVDMFTSVKWAEDNLDCVYKDWRKEMGEKQ